MASFEAGLTTRATTIAISSARSGSGADSNQAAAPQARAASSTAATWPRGSVHSMLSSACALGTATPPRNSTRKCSISCASQCERLASVRFLTLPASR